MNQLITITLAALMLLLSACEGSEVRKPFSFETTDIGTADTLDVVDRDSSLDTTIVDASDSFEETIADTIADSAEDMDAETIIADSEMDIETLEEVVDVADTTDTTIEVDIRVPECMSAEDCLGEEICFEGTCMTAQTLCSSTVPDHVYPTLGFCCIEQFPVFENTGLCAVSMITDTIIFYECVETRDNGLEIRETSCIDEHSYTSDSCDPARGCENVLIDTDGDGVFDRDDQCLTVPEDLDHFDDLDGCPEGGWYCLNDHDCEQDFYCAVNSCEVFVDEHGDTGLGQPGTNGGPFSDGTPDDFDDDGDGYCETAPCVGSLDSTRSVNSLRGGDCDDDPFDGTSFVPSGATFVTDGSYANHPDAPEWLDGYDNNCDGTPQ